MHAFMINYISCHNADRKSDSGYHESFTATFTSISKTDCHSYMHSCSTISYLQGASVIRKVKLQTVQLSHSLK